MKKINLEDSAFATDKTTGPASYKEKITSFESGANINIQRVILDFEGRERSFVIKDYLDGPDDEARYSDRAREHVEHSIKIYAMLREVGAPTYTTYRAESNGTSILMTDLEAEGAVALGTTKGPDSWGVMYQEKKNIVSVANLEQLFEEMKGCVLIGNTLDMELSSDAYFLLASKTDEMEYELHAFVGDFDGVNVGDQLEEADLGRTNHLAAGLVVYQVLETYMSETDFLKYKNQILDAFPGMEDYFHWITRDV